MSFLSKPNWLQRAHDLGISYRTVIVFVILSLATMLTEVMGVGIFLPIFQFIRLKGDLNALVADSSLWQYVIDLFAFFSIKPSLLILLLSSFSFFIGRQILVYLRLVYTTAVAQRLVQLQRNRLFNRYIQAKTEYHDSVPVGDLVNVIVTEVNSAVVGAMLPLELIVYIIMLMGYIGVLSILSWQMTIFSIIVIIIAAIVPKMWIKQSATTGRKLVGANTLMSEFLVGRLRSPRLVRLSGTENAEKKEFHNLTLKQRKHMVFSSILQSKTEVSIEPFIIGMSLVFLYVSYDILKLQIEVIGLYLVVVMRLMPIVKSIVILCTFIYI